MNELSITSVGRRRVAVALHAATARAATAPQRQRAGRLARRCVPHMPRASAGGIAVRVVFDSYVGDGRNVAGARRYPTSCASTTSWRAFRGRAAGAPAGCSQQAAARSSASAHERRVLDAAAVEGVGAARMEAAAARRLRRVGHLARERLGQEAAAVGVRDRARSAPRVYGCSGSSRAAASARSRPSRPRYMTETASATWRTIARSCEIRSRPRPSSRERSRAGSRAAPGRRRRARRAARRGRSPTARRRARARSRSAAAGRRENSCGKRSAAAGGQADELEQLADAAGARRCGARPSVVSASRELRADPAARVERRVRVLEDELQPGELAVAAAARRAASTSRPSKTDRARRSVGTSPTAARASVDLPQPDSPTRPTICPGSTREARARRPPARGAPPRRS